MNKTIVGSAVGAGILTVAVGVGAVVMLKPTQPDLKLTQPDTAQAAGHLESPQTPESLDKTIAGEVAGIGLPALNFVEGIEADKGTTIVNIWAWWCEPCREEMPLLAHFAAQNPQVTVVGVHADPAASQGQAFLSQLGVELPSYQDDDNSFAGTLGLPSVIPITLVLRDGKVVTQIVKAFHSQEEVDKALGQYL